MWISSKAVLQNAPSGVRVSPGGVKDDRSSDVHYDKNALGEAQE